MTIISSVFLYCNFTVVEIVKSFTKNNLTDESLSNLKEYNENENISNFFRIFLDKYNYKNQKFLYKFDSQNSFDRYYRYEEYSSIKKSVDGGITISIGIDPMIAAMNGIKVADGYYVLYSAEYKKKFEKIIIKELQNNISLYNYFKNWGNRVYAFYSDKNNLLIDFVEAKKVGADYVISTFLIKNKNLRIICAECGETTQLFLYKIL